MNVTKIREIIGMPHVLKRILGTYEGAYSLGIGRASKNQAPDHEGGYVIMLMVEDEEPEGFPEEIDIGGEKIPVDVQGAFTAPEAMGVRRKPQRRRDARRSATIGK